jgi:hypothetical protein
MLFLLLSPAKQATWRNEMSRRFLLHGALIVVFGLSLLAAGPASAAPPTLAPAANGTTQYTLSVAQPWINTGIAVPMTPGATFTWSIQATGTVKLAATDPGTQPNGYLSQGCVAGAGWVAPGLTCYALVGRFGTTGPPFFIGANGSGSVPPLSGPTTLYLSVNDELNGFSDNIGTWAVTITFTAATRTSYFAEGFTGGTFDEYLVLANPYNEPVTAAVAFQYAAGSTGPAGMDVTLSPNQRRTLSIDSLVGAGKEVSLRVSSTKAVVAERPMYFSNYPAAGGLAYNRPRASALSGITGGHLGVPALAPNTTWYFAEGYTGDGFEGYFTLQNPGAAASNVTITYFLANGGVQARSVTVGAGQRLTVVIHGAAAQGGIGVNQTFSARLVGTQPIIAERVQYFNYQGSMGAVTGGTATLGANAAALTWYFAEGYTGPGFDEYLTIQNPNADPMLADITYFVEGQPTPTTRTVTLPPNSRTTVVVHGDPSAANPGGLGRGKTHATRVATTYAGGIIVERPMYFRYAASGGGAGIDGGHNVMGATGLVAPGQSVVMAEGFTGAGFDQYLTFQNPNASPVAVTITYLKADGTTVAKQLSLPANQRTTVTVHNPAGAGLGPGQEFATMVTVPAGAAGGVLVERVNYFRYLGTATGGSAAFGQALP